MYKILFFSSWDECTSPPTRTHTTAFRCRWYLQQLIPVWCTGSRLWGHTRFGFDLVLVSAERRAYVEVEHCALACEFRTRLGTALPWPSPRVYCSQISVSVLPCPLDQGVEIHTLGSLGDREPSALPNRTCRLAGRINAGRINCWEQSLRAQSYNGRCANVN